MHNSMSYKALSTSPFCPRQAPIRRDVIGATVTAQERQKILAAYEQAGFKNISHGSRVVNLAFAESAGVRDAVAAWRRDNPAAAT